MTDKHKPGRLDALRQAVLAVDEMQAKLDCVEQQRTEPIAIIGMGCRLPGGITDPESYWQLLRHGSDAIGEVPPERWDWNDFPGVSPDEPGLEAIRWGGFLDNIDGFDAAFFGIAPREAEKMDPQQRLFLEVAWEALENAGQAPDRLEGSRTGVYAGVCTSDYANLQTQSGLDQIDPHYASGIGGSVLPGRLSYLLGLAGPSVALDTACSSSLVAVHLACQGIRNGETDMAIAGGINVILLPNNAVAFSRSDMMAANGRCKTFDAKADGFVRAEGCGIVILKRLSDAIANGDSVHALIRGSAVNQDGASSGLTAPHGPSQEAVIRSALGAAGIEPEQVSYVEAHGTGTKLGDPIEVQALGAALASERSQENPLWIGSVKTNLGHLEAAAGIAGLIKVALSLKNRELAPNVHFESPNPHISWSRWPIRVADKLTPWKIAKGSRIAGVSSFGFSGTNAHVILEEASQPVTEPESHDRSTHLMCLAAKSATALRDVACNYAEYLGEHSAGDLSAICYTANTGRARLPYRAVVCGRSADAISKQLRAFSAGEEYFGVTTGHVSTSEPPKTAFLFTGQGSQYAGMARELFENQPEFRRHMVECDRLLRPYLDKPLLSVLYDDIDDDSIINETAFAQPALFAVEYSLAQLWQNWGVQPSLVMGHSVGELVAACLAGAFDLDVGLRMVAERGRLMHALQSDGQMVVIFADEASVAEALTGFESEVSIAAINEAENTVISGDGKVIESLVDQFLSQDVHCQPLVVSQAFHSPLVEPMVNEFREFVKTLTIRPTNIDLVSNITGEVVPAGTLLGADYWATHIRQPVRFRDAVRTAAENGVGVFLEVGSHPTLSSMGQNCVPDTTIKWIHSLRRDTGDWEQMLEGVAQLHVFGSEINWEAFHGKQTTQRRSLPTYPFQRERFWFEDTRSQIKRRSEIDGLTHPLLHRQTRSPLVKEIVYGSFVDRQHPSYIAEHRVFDTVVLPAAAFIEMISVAARHLFGGGGLAIEEFGINEALVIPDTGALYTQLVFSPDGDQTYRFQLISLAGARSSQEESFRSHASGTVRMSPDNEDSRGLRSDIEDIRARCDQVFDLDNFYQNLSRRGIHLGPQFRNLEELRYRDGECIGLVSNSSKNRAYQIHPTMLDACLQSACAVAFSQKSFSTGDTIYMPFAVQRIRILSVADERLWSHVRLCSKAGEDSETITVDLTAYNDKGMPVIDMQALQLKRATPELLKRAIQPDFKEWLYHSEWQREILPQYAEPSFELLPAPSIIAATVSPSVTSLNSENGLDLYDRLLPEIDDLCNAYIWCAFEKLGWKPEFGEAIDLAEFSSRLRVAARHHRLLARLLDILVEDGQLDYRDNCWHVIALPARVDVKRKFDELAKRYKSQPAELVMVGRAGARMADILRDDCDVMAVIFPEGSFDLAHQLYRNSPAARVLNGLAERSLQTMLDRLPIDQNLKVLEIGAGTGGTTSFLLPVISPVCDQYVFSDISDAFISQARQDFSDTAFMQYALLDIEKDPLSQGFSEHGFDLIVAANVLHATENLRETLTHVKRLLKPGGMLMLLEGTRPQRWIDLTFGLTEGWWRFTDYELRPSYALMPFDRWADLLGNLGFADISPIPTVDAQGPGPEHIVVLAQAPMLDSEAADTAAWLMFCDDDDVGAELAGKLQDKGDTVVLVKPGKQFLSKNDGFHVTLDSPADYERVFREGFAARNRVCRGVIHTWCAESYRTRLNGSSDLDREQAIGCRSVLNILQSASAIPGFEVPSIVLVTRGAQSVAGSDPIGLVHAPIWGLSNVVALEHVDVPFKCIDLDPVSSSRDSGYVFGELTGDRRESRVAFRNGVRYVARLSRVRSSQRESASTPIENEQLRSPDTGLIEDLRFEQSSRTEPSADEVEIHVRATGMNFRDVLIALGMYPDPVATLGGECAGIITAVGPDVRNLRIGDQVVTMAPGCFGMYVHASERLTVPKPASLSFEEAATLPSAFTTAYCAITKLGRLTADDRVLIHAAAGGVGQAAVQIAQRVGAEIFATAGSLEKRNFLRSLGVRHVFDSRTLDFKQQIMDITGGEGIDVVLNCLSDEFVDASFGVLARTGRFLELGKRGIWDHERVSEMLPGAEYHIIDLSATAETDPDMLGGLLGKVMAAFSKQEIVPLPLRTFDRSEIVEAFRYMASASHIGKIVISRPDYSDIFRCRDLHEVGSILITGGFGGLGIAVAEWLVNKGAQSIILMGRNAPDEAALQVIRTLEETGASIKICCGDVSEIRDVQDIVDSCTDDVPALAGVVHAAGVLDDGVILRQDWQQFANVLAPKVQGGWNLHMATKDLPLDFFVLFSSISSVLGSPGQSNHSAANAFLDVLAHHRRYLGLPAQSINWGVWSEIGAAATNKAVDRVRDEGVGSFSPEEGLEVFDWILKENKSQIAVMPVDWPQLITSMWSDKPPAFLVQVMQKPESVGVDEPASASTLAQELDSVPGNLHMQTILNRVQTLAATSLGFRTGQPIDINQPLQELGLDSLMAVQLRNSLATNIGCSKSLPATLVFDYPTISDLALFVAGELAEDGSKRHAELPASSKDVGQETLGSIENMSEEDLDRQLAARIGAGN